MRRPLVEPRRKSRLAYFQEGLEKGYPQDPNDRRIFMLPTPLESFLPIALKCMTLDQWKEATKPKFYGDIRYKPVGEYVPPVEVPGAAAYPETAPSTAAPAAAD